MKYDEQFQKQIRLGLIYEIEDPQTYQGLILLSYPEPTRPAGYEKGSNTLKRASQQKQELFTMVGREHHLQL